MQALNNDYDTIKEHLASNLRRLRKAQKKSQRTLAIEADVDRSYIGDIENKKYSASLKILCALAKALQVNVEDLVKPPPLP